MNQTKLPLDKLNNVLIFLKKKGLTQEVAEDMIHDSCIIFLTKEKTTEILDPFSYFFNIVNMKLLNYFSIKKRRKTSIVSVAVLNNLPSIFIPLSYNEGEFTYDYKEYVKMLEAQKAKKLEEDNSNKSQALMLYTVHQMKHSERARAMFKKSKQVKKYD